MVVAHFSMLPCWGFSWSDKLWLCQIEIRVRWWRRVIPWPGRTGWRCRTRFRRPGWTRSGWNPPTPKWSWFPDPGSNRLLWSSTTENIGLMFKMHSHQIELYCSIHPPHLSKGQSGLKQKCTQTPTSFWRTIFHALSHNVIHFVPRVISKNLEMEVSDWLLKNFNQGESGFST